MYYKSTYLLVSVNNALFQGVFSQRNGANKYDIKGRLVMNSKNRMNKSEKILLYKIISNPEYYWYWRHFFPYLDEEQITDKIHYLM